MDGFIDTYSNIAVYYLVAEGVDAVDLAALDVDLHHGVVLLRRYESARRVMGDIPQSI